MSLKKYMNLHPFKLYHGLFGPAVGPTMLGVVASLLSMVCKRMQQFSAMLAHHACSSITRSYLVAVSKEMVCNERAWLQQCWKSCTNGSNIVALRFGDHGTKEMLGAVGLKVCPVSNFA